MANANKYEDMSALDALQYASEGNLLLPDIQREYVWDISEIEDLFESIVDDYPIGSCIFWKTNRKTINEERPNLYHFISVFKKGSSHNQKADEILSKECDYYIVLDGQQRITSMNIGLKGEYTYYRGGKGHLRSNPKSWITKQLYYDLDFYKTKEEEEEYPKKRFRFLTSQEADAGNFYKIKEILSFDKTREFYDEMSKRGFSDKTKDDLTILFERIRNSSSNGLVHYYCISEKTYDKALDIFVRVNSTGRKLSKSDLLFSTIINGWKEGKENIENLLATMNCKGDGFCFSRDYLMRLCLVLVDANTSLKINSLTQETIKNIHENWKRIDDSLDKLSTMLSEIGMCDENLTSYNATMPLAYYIYKGGSFGTKESKKEARKYLSVALAKRIFGVASNEALNSTRKALADINCKRTPFSLSLFSMIEFTGGRRLSVNEADIDYWLDTYEKGRNTFLLLSLLYPRLKLSQQEFHQDHCHPYTGFEKDNIASLLLPDEKVKEWQRKRNLLPNLQFMKGNENQSKNKTPLKTWVEGGEDFDFHPVGVSLELKDFDEFFNRRRELVKEELMKVFEITK